MVYIVPIVALFLVFGAPWLVGFLQGRRLATLEQKLAELTVAIRSSGRDFVNRADQNA